MKRRMLILGSGVCGLAIAIRLLETDPSLDVVLLESEDRVGGLARSLTLHGQVADMGPHRIHTELPDVQQFLKDIAGEEMVRVERKSSMWLRGEWIEYPPRIGEILRVIGPTKVFRAGLSWLGGTIGRLWPWRAHEENYESVMTRAFGSELYRLIVLDYTRKVWKIDPRELHADIARVRVSAGGLDRLARRLIMPEKEGQETALKKFYYIPGGVEKLVDKMRERALSLGAKIITDHRVTDITPLADKKWRVTTESHAGTETHDADFVFSTIPVTDLVEILQRYEKESASARARRSMRFIANFLVLVVVNKPHVTRNQWLYFPGTDTIFNRGYEPKNFSTKMGTQKQTMIVMEITCHHGDETWNSTDEQLIESTLKGLQATGLVRRDEVIETSVYRIPNTYPLYDLQYRSRLDDVWHYLALFPNLISVGRQGLFLHNNMDHSIHMGFRAAAVALKEHPDDASEHFYQEVRRFQQFRIVD